MCLDWANRALDLGLDFEDMWKAEIDSSNIIIFITECFAADDAFGHLTMDLASVEDLVVPAIHYIDSCDGKQATGKMRLQKIIERVLESGRGLDWVFTCGESISRILASGPSEKLLEHCQRKNKRLREDQKLRSSEGVCDETPENKARGRISGGIAWWTNLRRITRLVCFGLFGTLVTTIMILTMATIMTLIMIVTFGGEPETELYYNL